MKLRFGRSAFAIPLLCAAAACGGSVSNGGTTPGADGGTSGSDGGAAQDGQVPNGDGGTTMGNDGAMPPPPIVTSGKIDLLFMIDNSASMGDKQAILGVNVTDMVGRLVNPNCVDPSNRSTVLGASTGGTCAQGVLEFKPIVDMHIGIVSSSLGGRGSDECATPSPNPVNQALDRHNDDQAHLINRVGDDEHALTDAAPSNFLAWLPQPGGAKPPVFPIASSPQLFSDLSSLVSGVHQYGCGFEAQLESWYRFLVQPDPYASIVVNGGRAAYQGVDTTLLQQRHDFPRPDSLLAVVVLTDENDSTVDPLALQGQGWAYENSGFPANNCNGCTGTAPKATAACATNPNDPSCDSCFFHQSSAECNPLFYETSDDNLNVRFFHMKQRFGVDPQFPITRYVRGLSQAKVPNSASEHVNASATYTGETNANCTNPIFAASLPTDATADLCNLQAGPRQASQVFFLVIGGVPHQLLQVDPSNPNSAQKASLSADDWKTVLGTDPLNYDFTGVDPHMLESMTPRAGLQGPSAADNADPINGRDYDTGGADLEYACVFDLPMPKDCTSAANIDACDCEAGYKGPLCQAQGSTTQTRAKAYPTIRELAVARALGAQGVVSSICPIHTTEAVPGDPLFGYRPAMNALVTQMSGVLPK